VKGRKRALEARKANAAAAYADLAPMVAELRVAGGGGELESLRRDRDAHGDVEVEVR
jgi:hypothetical protein